MSDLQLPEASSLVDRRLLAAASTPDLAMEVVEVLEPHGEYYAQWLFKPDRRWAACSA